MHEVERDEQPDSGRATRWNSNQDNRAGHVDNGESDHGKEGLIPFGDDESGVSVYTLHDIDHLERLRHSHVKSDTNEGERNFQELTCQDIETESSIDEETVKFPNTTDDHGLE